MNHPGSRIHASNCFFFVVDILGLKFLRNKFIQKGILILETVLFWVTDFMDMPIWYLPKPSPVLSIRDPADMTNFTN